MAVVNSSSYSLAAIRELIHVAMSSGLTSVGPRW
jgi:hypothetical protein